MNDLLARLIAAGTPADLVGEVAMALARAEAAQEAIEARRANDRERTARRRSREVTECHVTTRDVTDAPSLSPAPLSSPQTPQQTPHPHTHPDNTTRAREDDPFPRPEWCEPQVWRDLKANRKAKRLPCTPTAHAKLMRDIDKLVDDDWPPGRLLEAIVARGWAAAYDPREERAPANDRTIQHRFSSTATAAARARANLGC